jgi:hypothetical protein
MAVMAVIVVATAALTAVDMAVDTAEVDMVDTAMDTEDTMVAVMAVPPRQSPKPRLPLLLNPKLNPKPLPSPRPTVIAVMVLMAVMALDMVDTAALMAVDKEDMVDTAPDMVPDMDLMDMAVVMAVPLKPSPRPTVMVVMAVDTEDMDVDM